MHDLTNDEMAILTTLLAANGTLPDRIAREGRCARLMQFGLVEAIKPPAPYLPYVTITTACEQEVAQRVS